MDATFGLVGKDFVILAADRSLGRSITVMKDDEDKIHKLSNNMVMAVTGEPGDTTQFAEYISKNIQLYKMRNGYGLSTQAAANFTRKNLADSLRSRSPYNVNILMAGFDAASGPELFFLDYLASLKKMKFAAHGYGGMYTMSIMDKYYTTDLTQEAAYNIMKLCVMEVQQRLIINLPNFAVQIIDKDGVKEMPAITSKALALAAQ